MLTSMRPTHEFFNPKYDDNRVSNGKLCAACTHIFEIDETPLGRTPRTIEAIRQEITGSLRARVAHRVSGWQDATKAAGDNRKKLRDGGVFTHDPERQKLGGTGKEQRFNEVKSESSSANTSSHAARKRASTRSSRTSR